MTKTIIIAALTLAALTGAAQSQSRTSRLFAAIVSGAALPTH